MSDLLIALFIDDTVKEFKLSTLLSRTTGTIMDRDVLESRAELILPLYKVGSEWVIRTPEARKVEISVNSEKVKEKTIAHGDYITVSHLDTQVEYSMLITDVSRCGLHFHKYKLEPSKPVFIGRLPESDIYFNLNNSVSRKHAAIRLDAEGGAHIEDLSGKTGIYVNGKRVSSSKLSAGDIIYIVGLKIIYLDHYIAVSSLIAGTTLSPLKPEYRQRLDMESRSEAGYFTRSPRIMKTLESGVFEIDPPPTLNKAGKMPLLFTLGPSMTMMVAMLVSLSVTISNASSGSSVVASAAMTVSMLTGAILWPILINRYQLRVEKAELQYREQRYLEYLGKQKKALEEKYQRNRRILNETLFPGPDTVAGFLRKQGSQRRLWERTPEDGDFLAVRLGIGEDDFQVVVSVPKQGFVLDEDPLAEEPMKIASQFAKLQEVPIAISLKENRTIGLIGEWDRILNNTKAMALHLAGLHAPDEVKLVLIYNEKTSQHFEWARELPHVWSTDRSLRHIATNRHEVHQLFHTLDETLKEREAEENRKARGSLPHYVFIIADEKLVEGEPLMRYIGNPRNQVGVTGVFVYGAISRLPKECEAIIQNETDCGIYYKNKFNNRFLPFTPDEVSDDLLLDFSRGLSRLSIKTEYAQLSVPERVSFLGMYRAGNIEELNIEGLWEENLSYKSLAAPIGIKAGGEVFNLDIHENYHGSHGLVAGMTGSGKSEFLQAYIISAAINYHPHDLSFVLIDYKGGGMANIFDGMPHIAGKITNLSGSQLNRSLISIKAELNRRQLLFNEYNVNHIDKYQKMYKEGRAATPLPHLVLISDEFAQLKTQQPEFMKELIDVAQIGRSLGIHLILATQKPSGVVDDQIWSNSKFRICLKVLDKYDSNEMIKKPDAAMIKLPGRCYVQVGYDEVYEYIQSGYSGLDYAPLPGYIDEDELTVSMIDSTAALMRSAKTDTSGTASGQSQLEALIHEIISIAERNSIPSLPLWLEPLKEELALDELERQPGFDGVGWPDRELRLEATVGMADFPKSQQQLPLSINLLKDGHVVLYGASGTGKTTFLQTLIYSLAESCSPENIHVHILDFGGRTLGYFAELPHCLGVAYADDEVQVEAAIEGLIKAMEQRKRLFAEHGTGSYEGYCRGTKNKLPAIVLVLDNYSGFKERYHDLEDQLVKIASNGKTYGIYLIITGNSKGAIYYRITEHVSNFLTLRMNDSFHYREILNTSSIPIEPDNVRGRGLAIAGDVVEFQTALVVKAENEMERISYIRDRIAAYNEAWEGPRAGLAQAMLIEQVAAAASERAAETTTLPARMPRLPRKAGLPLLEINEHMLMAGVQASSGRPHGLELQNLHTFFIASHEENSHPAHLMQMIRDAAEQPNRQLVLIDRSSRELAESYSEAVRRGRYLTTAADVDAFTDELESLMDVRLADYRHIRENAVSEETVYGWMQKHEALFIFINGFNDFYDMISDEAAEKWAQLIPAARGLNIYIVTSGQLDKLAPYNATELYMYLVRANKGILIEIPVHSQHIFDFPNMTHHERTKLLPAGYGYLVDGDQYDEIKCRASLGERGSHA
ncbi:type VII secretion protein EssC [Paenibacillus aurantiacus]|uniref:Type VII secretion protein EssC n=1 Tax=Paenibacillus aurantiacus TaxID=1936118 RepID=A0ABV5KKT8_9BACL